jgi:hypothetical protein
MTISEGIIKNAVLRYHREYGTYLASLASIRKLINISEPMTEVAQNAIDEFETKRTANDEARFTLDRDSSDILLVLLLRRVANYILSSSDEAVSNGVVRRDWFAGRFQEISKVESIGMS